MCSLVRLGFWGSRFLAGVLVPWRRVRFVTQGAGDLWRLHPMYVVLSTLVRWFGSLGVIFGGEIEVHR